MKRIGFVMNKIQDIDNIKLAHSRARRGKSNYKSIKLYESNEEFLSQELSKMLKDRTYTIDESDYTTSIINDKGKSRTLRKLDYYPHRVLQWAIINVVGDTLVRSMTSDTYASIKGRGIHKLVDRLKKGISNLGDGCYCLKIDVKKFYDSIDHAILVDKLERKFKDRDFINLLTLIISSTGGSKGLPIGSLLSQYLANFYLSELDHRMKELKGVEYYYRYMDDIVVLHQDKNFLHSIRSYLENQLNSIGLEIRSNWQLYKVSDRGIDYVGYRLYLDKVRVRKRIISNIQRSINSRIVSSLSSYKGWLNISNARKLLARVDRELNFNRRS